MVVGCFFFHCRCLLSSRSPPSHHCRQGVVTSSPSTREGSIERCFVWYGLFACFSVLVLVGQSVVVGRLVPWFIVIVVVVIVSRLAWIPSALPPQSSPSPPVIFSSFPPSESLWQAKMSWHIFTADIIVSAPRCLGRRRPRSANFQNRDGHCAHDRRLGLVFTEFLRSVSYVRPYIELQYACWRAVELRAHDCRRFLPSILLN